MVAVHAGFRAWQAAGRDPGPNGRYVEESLGPLLQAGKLSEAETVLEAAALRRLAAPPRPPARQPRASEARGMTILRSSRVR